MTFKALLSIAVLSALGLSGCNPYPLPGRLVYNK